MRGFGHKLFEVLYKLLFLPVSFQIQLDAALLTPLSGALFAFAIWALYWAFQIGPIRLVAPIIGAYPVFSVLWVAF